MLFGDSIVHVVESVTWGVGCSLPFVWLVEVAIAAKGLIVFGSASQAGGVPLNSKPILSDSFCGVREELCKVEGKRMCRV